MVTRYDIAHSDGTESGNDIVAMGTMLSVLMECNAKKCGSKLMNAQIPRQLLVFLEGNASSHEVAAPLIECLLLLHRHSPDAVLSQLEEGRYRAVLSEVDSQSKYALFAAIDPQTEQKVADIDADTASISEQSLSDGTVSSILMVHILSYLEIKDDSVHRQGIDTLKMAQIPSVFVNTFNVCHGQSTCSSLVFESKLSSATIRSEPVHAPNLATMILIKSLDSNLNGSSSRTNKATTTIEMNVLSANYQMHLQVTGCSTASAQSFYGSEQFFLETASKSKVDCTCNMVCS